MGSEMCIRDRSRANYYTAGSPVQFVRVELLKGDMTGEVAVCLTFKNVGTEPLTGLVVHFKCKDAAGQVLCEDDFYYEQLNAQPGAGSAVMMPFMSAIRRFPALRSSRTAPS